MNKGNLVRWLLLTALLVALYALPLPVEHQLTQIVALMGVMVCGSIAVVGVAAVARALFRKPSAWARRASWRAANPLWIGAALCMWLVLIALGALTETPQLFADVLTAALPLCISLQAAVAFVPADEPPLEVLLACPRGMAWLVLERLAGIGLGQGAAALIGMVVATLIAPQHIDFGALLLRWLPAALFLSGIGLYVTLRSGNGVFGMMIAAVVWVVMLIFTPAFLPQTVIGIPLVERVQPFWWSIGVYLTPSHLSADDYVLNRALLVMLGITLLVLVIYPLREAETLLVESHEGA